MKKAYSFLLFLTIMLVSSKAQNPRGGGGGFGAPTLTFSGSVVDEDSNQPLEFSTISLYNTADSTLVTGGITDVEGKFLLEKKPTGKPEGRPESGERRGPKGMYAIIEYIGYEAFVLSPINIDKSKFKQGDFNTDLGVITLSQGGLNLSEVEVTAEKSEVQFSLDKKVFNVGKDLANQGGTASDVLDNVPSVTVDTEGEVSLRGSTGVRILIDGKPSTMSSDGDALRQLPANLIEKVEVITNPSARYEAEGMAGIINIVLKKEDRSGFNGSFETTVGLPEIYGAGANLNYRKGKINWFLNYGINYRRVPGGGFAYIESTDDDGNLNLIDREFLMNRGGINHSVRAGLDYHFSDKETLTGAFLYKFGDEDNFNEINYLDYLENTTTGLLRETNRTDDEFEDESSLEYSLNYLKEFSSREHSLNVLASYQDRLETEGSELYETITHTNNKPQSFLEQASNNSEGQRIWLFQVDYIQPLEGKDHKFELGLRTSLRDVDNDYLVEEMIEGAWSKIPDFSNVFEYDEDVFAAYGQYGKKIGNFGFLAGLRGEYSNVTTLLKEGDIPQNERDYLNLFPSLFLNYEFSPGNSIQTSYSRRIRRPRFWDLNPFFTYSDPRSFFSGNPDLDPEYTDSYEINFIKVADKANFSGGIYYRHTTDVIQRIVEYENDTIVSFTDTEVSDTAFLDSRLMRPENLGTSDNYGVELTFSYSALKWLRLDGGINGYRFVTDGTNIDSTFRVEANTFDGRLSSRFTFWDANLQVRLNYRAPRETVQGRNKSMTSIDLGWSKDFGKTKNWTATVSVKDLLNQRKRRYENFGPDFYEVGEFQWRSRTATLTFTYRVNQKKQFKRGGRGGSGRGGDGEF